MANTTLTCQHCGDPVPSPRHKQCVRCRALKDGANKFGNYGATVQRMNDAQALGLTGDAFHAHVAAAAQTALAYARQIDLRAAEELKRQQAEHQKRADEREATNKILRAAGFFWRKHENDEEDADFFNLPTYEWVLHDKSTATETRYGDVVTIREAMERASGRGNAEAQQWLMEHPLPKPKTLSHGELWQECERRGCDNEPVCVTCFYCATHCTC